ncbi:hypothetical protein [Vacuolonema iberomarrocanum]|uniref:hypothetical protein n=1 Tax=Vacuolonema iberomarrocanum TaxID=3454632 RepID=UPI0019F91DE1|nr:hypothetical protein [filamentous cyanobacterium LEGE 07170]
MSVVNKIKAAKFVSNCARDARLGLALEASEYAEIAKSCGLPGSWEIGQRAYRASTQQLGKAKPLTWQEDANWTKH